MLVVISVLFLSTIKNIECQNDSATVTYYEDVITRGISESYVYPLPKDASAFKPNSNETKVYGTFDYIIIGSGSAGSVMASRLSEDANRTVLLLEAGGLENTFTELPGLALYAQGLQFNWNFNTTPQTNCCLGTIKQQCPFPRGLALGGTTVINGLMYVRGNKLDYDDWCNQGNPGWCYEDVLPFFKTSEHCNIPDADPNYHGYHGYQNVEYTGYKSPQLSAFLQANLELGVPIVDYNGRRQLGASVIQHNSVNGTRQSGASAFLLPARNRTNLTVNIHAYVIKVLIGTRNKTAYGVVFSKNRRLYVAYADKEVILCAGAVGSPQILMLSGIGPRSHLLKHGITPLCHHNSLSSVGDAFQDQVVYYGLNFVTNYTEPPRSLREYIQEYLDGYGPFTVYSNQQEFGFYQTKLEKRRGYPDVQILITPSNNTQSYVQKSYHLTDEVYDSAFGPVNPERSFTLAVVVIHPKSVGKLRLKSRDPYEYPLIDPRFYSDSRGIDLETMRLGIELAINLVNNTRAFRALNARLVYNPVKECKRYAYLSKDYWYCQIRYLSLANYHPTGSCKMGPNPRNGAVVDHELKVHGVKGLRVADASVFPKTISGNTNAPTVMVAEKASYMIRHGK